MNSANTELPKAETPSEAKAAAILPGIEPSREKSLARGSPLSPSQSNSRAIGSHMSLPVRTHRQEVRHIFLHGRFRGDVFRRRCRLIGLCGSRLRPCRYRLTSCLRNGGCSFRFALNSFRYPGFFLPLPLKGAGQGYYPQNNIKYKAANIFHMLSIF